MTGPAVSVSVGGCSGQGCLFRRLDDEHLVDRVDDTAVEGKLVVGGDQPALDDAPAAYCVRDARLRVGARYDEASVDHREVGAGRVLVRDRHVDGVGRRACGELAVQHRVDARHGLVVDRDGAARGHHHRREEHVRGARGGIGERRVVRVGKQYRAAVDDAGVGDPGDRIGEEPAGEGTADGGERGDDSRAPGERDRVDGTVPPAAVIVYRSGIMNCPPDTGKTLKISPVAEPVSATGTLT